MLAEYIRLSKGKTNYKLIPKDDNIWNHITDPDNNDYYKSIYIYNDKHYKIWKEKKSLSGIKDVTTDRLYFDFDSKENIELARQDTLTLASRLVQHGIAADSLQINFTGSKGFSVELEINKRLNPDEFKRIVFGLASDLNTFDTTIRDPQRIVRITGTKHDKTDSYKFPLSLNQLAELPLDNIIELSKDYTKADEDLMSAWCAVELPNGILTINQEEKKPDLELIEILDNDLDLTLKPKWLSEPKYALQEGYFKEGDRNTALMILATTYKAQGFNREIVYRMLKGVAENQAKRNSCERYGDDELWNNIVLYVFNSNFDSTEHSYKKSELLLKTCKQLNLKHETTENVLVTTDQLKDIFKNFAENIDKNTMKLGIPKIDNVVRITTSMLVGVLAAPSAGKTSISLNILNSASKNDNDCIFFSLDMGAPLIFQRIIQKHTGMRNDDLFRMYQDEKKDEIEKIVKIIDEEYKNVKFCFKSGITVEDMRDYIIEHQNKTGRKTKLVVCDYLECIQGPYSDPTSNTAIIAQKLKDIANELDLTLILLLQPQKHAGDPSAELLSYRQVKGSSAIEQAASVILTLWRPGFSAKDTTNDRYLSVAAVKNRMGGLGKFDFKWNGLTGTVSDLEDFEREELDELVEKIKREKAEKKDEF